MKVLRQSFRGVKGGEPQHIPITPKSATAIMPPKRVIKALRDYEPPPEEKQKLRFSKGDFFHVISREDDPEWYEACSTTRRGLVPVAYFEIIDKTERQSGASVLSVGAREGYDAGFSSRDPGPYRTETTTNTTRNAANARTSASIGKGSGAMVFGTVLYDFNAVRQDELQAKAGEAVIVIAQSNPEWFVAKPIGRLGGPGLIPVSFIEIRDIATGQILADPLEAVQKAGVPKVEEWKEMVSQYKDSSISLGKTHTPQQVAIEMGRISLGSAQTSSHLPNASYQTTSGTYGPPPGQYYRQSPPQPISASLPRYCFDNDKYWYIIECQMEDGQDWELWRSYMNFLDFQVLLLEEFPEEAGATGLRRTLPSMPGPLPTVTDTVASARRPILDEYIRKILLMPAHISGSKLVRDFFAPKLEDIPCLDRRLSGASQHSTQNYPSRSASRQSSNGAMNRNVYSGMSPPLNRLQQRPQPSLSTSTAVSANPSFLHTMNRQASSLTQDSMTSSNAQTSASAMKVKIMFEEEFINIRVPFDITYLELQDKLRDRLKLSRDIVLQYKDEPSNSTVDLQDDSALALALQRNTKLTIFVKYAADGRNGALMAHDFDEDNY